MFGRRRREEKLFKQWAKHADLPTAAIPKKETQTDKGLSFKAIPRKETYSGKDRRPFDVLYILLGVSLLILCVGIILIFN